MKIADDHLEDSMYVLIDEPTWGLDPCMLMETRDVDALSVMASRRQADSVVSLLLGCGAGRASDHDDEVFVSIDWIIESARRAGVEHGDSFWNMVSNAEKSGWVDPSHSALRAHLAWID